MGQRCQTIRARVGTTTGTRFLGRRLILTGLVAGQPAAAVIHLTAEPFFNLNTTSFQPRLGLARVRSAISLSVPIAKAVELQAGYLIQRRFARDGEDRSDPALTATLALSL